MLQRPRSQRNGDMASASIGSELGGSNCVTKKGRLACTLANSASTDLTMRYDASERRERLVPLRSRRARAAAARSLSFRREP